MTYSDSWSHCVRRTGSNSSAVWPSGCSRELIEAEATARTGAEWNEHPNTRTALRNGHRDKTLTTRAGHPVLGSQRRRPTQLAAM